MTDTDHDKLSTAEQRRARAKVWFESLRDQICAEVEALEREAPEDLFPGAPATFTYKPWTRATGLGSLAVRSFATAPSTPAISR